MIANHPFIFTAILIVSWIGMYRAGLNDGRKNTRKAFESQMYGDAP